MKVLFKKRSVFALALAMVVTSLSMPVKAEEAASGGSVVGLGVAYHTQEEIAEFANIHAAPLDQPITYAVEPSLSEPYAAGVLSEETVNSALNMLNQVRYIAGVDANVTHDEDNAVKASAASLLNFLNDDLNHYPARPSVLSDSKYDELYNKGYAGAGASNIHASWGNRNPSLNSAIIKGWCADDDIFNIDRVGHRRWFLSPALTSVGFGATVQNSVEYSATYVDHEIWNTDPNVYVAWPAQEMPVQYFSSDYPWSLSLGYYPNGESISVSVTRKADGATWNFSNSGSDGDFYNGDSGYGSPGAIIFRPEGITIQSGDTYEVAVVISDSTTVQYEVNFFDLDAPGESGSTGGTDTDDTGSTGGTDTDDTGSSDGADTGDMGSSDGTNTGDTGSSDGADTGDTGSSDGTNTGNTGSSDGANVGNTGNSNGANTGNTGSSDKTNTNNKDTDDEDDSESDSDNTGANANAVFTERIVNVDWKAAESAIAAALQAGEGNTFVLTGTSYTVPVSIIKTFAGRNNALMLQSGSGLTFSISGKDVKNASTELKIDLSFAEVIPADVSRQVTNGAVLSRPFSLTDKSVLPFKVDVHLSLGAENAGKTATLYYYDESGKTMRSAGSFKITATGQAMFAVTRRGEYIVVVTGQASQNSIAGSYTVVSGDSLARIARKTGVSISDILRLNPQITNPNRIYPNQVIVLP